MTTALDAAALVVLLFLPLHLCIQWQLSRLCDPAYVRAHGVAVEDENALEHSGAVIGRYAGRDVFAQVSLLGIEYRFDRVVAPSYRHRVGACELYLPPGLLYLAQPTSMGT